VATIDIGRGVIEVISDYAIGAEVGACVRNEDITLAVPILCHGI
jgi:hypothetical protein